jgi:hypothetical protein
MKKTKIILASMVFAVLFFGFDSQKADAAINEWEVVGTDEFSAGSANGVNIAFNPSNNEPCVVYQDAVNSYGATAMRFNGTSWVDVGTPGFSSGVAGDTAIAFNPSTSEPYVVYKDGGNSNKATAMRFNGTSWVDVGTPGFSVGTAFYTDIAFNPSTNEPMSYIRMLIMDGNLQ